MTSFDENGIEPVIVNSWYCLGSSPVHDDAKMFIFLFIYWYHSLKRTHRNVPYYNVPHSGSFWIVHSSNWVGNNINRVNIKFLIMFNFVSAWSYVTTTEQASKKMLKELRLLNNGKKLFLNVIQFKKRRQLSVIKIGKFRPDWIKQWGWPDNALMGPTRTQKWTDARRFFELEPIPPEIRNRTRGQYSGPSMSEPCPYLSPKSDEKFGPESDSTPFDSARTLERLKILKVSIWVTLDMARNV